MMKRNILAVIVPALLVAGTANAAEIYNKDGNKVDLYGKAVGLHYFSKGNGENSYGGNGDMTYARLGFKGETQINSDLTGYGQWEYNFQGNNSEGADAQTGNKTRLAFAVNRPGFPGECFICELRLPDHRFRWKHNKLFLLLPEEYGPAFPAIVDCYTSPPT